MKYPLRATFLFAAALACGLLQPAAAAQTENKQHPKILAGFAERDISPEIGMERPGGYGKAFHKNFHDPCKVRAAVFDDGTSRVALVGLDTLIIRESQVRAARKAIHEKTGIAPAAILFGASHSHSSGPAGMVLPGEYDHADAFVQKLAYEESSNADPKFLELLVRQMIDAVVAAHDNRAEVELGFASGEEGGVSFNRRFRMRDGHSFTHPHFGNPDMIAPAGPIDPEVGAIGAWDSDGKLAGCVVTFACHATTSPPGSSANYIYYVEKAVRAAMGDDVVVVFLNGASGDVTQVDNRSPYRRQSGEQAAQLVGSQVGSEAVRAMLLAGRTDKATVAAKTKILPIARRKPHPDRLAASRRLVEAGPAAPLNRSDWIFSKEIVLLDALIAKSPVHEVEIQAIQVGPAVFVTTPAEYFCQFGLDQKLAIDFPFTWPVSLANGCVGYVPTEEALGFGGGGYETRLTSYSNLVPSAGRLMANAGIALANALEPDPVPESLPAPPYKEPWSYGATPPELE